MPIKDEKKRAEYQRKWQQENREKYLAYQKEYRDKNYDPELKSLYYHANKKP